MAALHTDICRYVLPSYPRRHDRTHMPRTVIAKKQYAHTWGNTAPRVDGEGSIHMLWRLDPERVADYISKPYLSTAASKMYVSRSLLKSLVDER